MIRSNLRITAIAEREEPQLKGTEHIFNKIIEVNLPNLKSSPGHIIVKSVNVQKDRVLKVAKEKDQVKYKDRP